MGKCIITRRGSGSSDKYYIYNNGVELNNHTISIYHQGQSKKDTNWIYLHGYYKGIVSSDKIINNGFTKLNITIMSDSRSWTYTPKYLTLYLTDEDGATLNGNDYEIKGNVLKTESILSYPDIICCGTTYEIDITGLSNFYFKVENVNTNSYIMAIWLE